MKKILSIQLLLLLSLFSFGQTPVSGTFSTDATLTLANSPYQVISSLVVNPGVTLTIESGVELKFNDNLKLDVNGTLIANGVTFSSSNSSPVAGSWLGIEILNGLNTLTNCQVLYAKTGVLITAADVDISGSSFTSSQNYAIYSDNKTPALSSTITASGITVAGAGSHGIFVNRSNFNLSNSSISGVGSYGILVENSIFASDALDPVTNISNTSFTDCAAAGIGIGGHTTTDISLSNITATGNGYPVSILNSATVAYSGTNNFSNNDFDVIFYSDASITDDMTLPNAGYPYYFSSTKTIENGAELTIASGNIIKMAPHTSIEVKGKLTAEAAVDETINFTSWYDDNIGGDSNNDSNNTSASTGKWNGIHFQSESDDLSVIRRADIRWINSYGAVRMTNASPTIDACNLQNARYGAELIGASSPTFTNNVIAASDQTPIAMSFEANPTFSNNSFSDIDNEYDAIGLLGGVMSQDGAIIKRNFTGLDNVTYVMLGSIEVPAGISLSIAPGIVIKSNHQNFIINGELLAVGTPTEPIVFTAVNDDNYGNPLDTRNDGTNLVPTVGNFGGIYFSETSDNTSKIDHAIIKFGNYTARYQTQQSPNGQRSYSYLAAIAINSAEPTITNTQIEEAKFGIDMRGLSSPVLTDNTIQNTEMAPFRQAIQTTPVYSGNAYSSVGWNGVAILPELINYTATLSQQAVAGFDNTLYIMDKVAINETAKITIAEGIQIKMPRSSNLEVFGGLKIAGTAANPVIFTSIADDNAGPYTDPLDNDTENNGNATDPTGTKWAGIKFYETSDDAFSSISHAKLSYGGQSIAPISWDRASANVDNTEIAFSGRFGLYFEGASNPVIDNVSINTSNHDPLAMSYFANPTFTNITFSTNGSNGINLIDTQLNADATVAKRDIAGINNIGYIMNALTIDNGATLTINPGVVMKLSGIAIKVNEGAIQAVGTPTEKIIFTSLKDDSRGGDTNIDGNGSVPAPNDWRGIVFRESTLQSNLQFAEFRYAGDALPTSGEGSTRDATIISENNNLSVDNCIIQLSQSNAFGAYGTSTASYTNNRLENINGYPVHLSMFSNPSFSGNVVENIKYFALGIQQESYNLSTTFPFRSFAGVDSITYIPVNVFGGGLTINSGTKITVPAGMHFKIAGGDVFTVNGELHVAGTVEDPVVFTHIKDDEFGRPLDTENDGLPNSVSPSYTLAKFNNISDDASLIENTIIRYAGEAVELLSASPTLDNNLIEHSHWGIVSTGISEPTYTNNTFKDLTFTPFTTSLVAYPTLTSGNTMEGTTLKAIRINTETLTQDTVIVKKSFGGINNIPYLFHTYTVGLGVKLTIDPGVIMKFYNGQVHQSSGGQGSLNVKGALVADGEPTTDGSIIFTSLFDDFYGGDTNSDSTNITNITTQWNGITFENESSDSESIIDNAVIRASYSSSGVVLNSASPTISNTLFLENGVSQTHGGILISGASNPTLVNNDFLDNGGTNGFGINNTGSFTVDATGSWWGHNSGPYHETLNPSGQGDEVRGNVTFDPWSTDNSQNPITGDVSLNGRVSAYDAALTLQNVASIITFEARQDRAGDVSGDGSVSAMDASYILQFAAGLIQSFPAEAENKRTVENFADTNSDAIVSIGNGEFTANDDEVSIPFSVSNVNAMHALSMKLPLGDHLEYVRFEQNNELTFNPTLNLDEESNEFNIAFGLTNGLNEDFQLGNLILKLNDDKVNVSYIDLEPSHLVGNETDIKSSAVVGRVNVNSVILGINDIHNGIQIYPNPAVNELNIVLPELSGQNVRTEIIDASGKIIIKAQKLVANDRVRLSNLKLKPGLYFLKVLTDQEQSVHQIVISQ